MSAQPVAEPVAAIAAIAVDAGALPLGGGLLALLRPALGRLQPGGALALLSSSKSTAQDLPAWCRLERHEYLGGAPLPDGRHQHLIRRGPHGVPAPRLPAPRLDGATPAAAAAPAGEPRPPGLPPRTRDLMAQVPPPARADPDSGFAPRGASVEPGGPPYPFTLLARDQVMPPETAELYEQAVAAQWDPGRDIPWHKAGRLPPAMAQALAQVMTFLAENELSALYVPSRFLARLHPAYAEVAMLLAAQLADEARHIDVFLKRAALLGVGLGVSSATTALSLRTLLAYDDFVEASFMLSVLGEGTFLDLLRFVEEQAPDEATAEIARRARADEARHVRFGLCHVRHALVADPTLVTRLEQAVRRRAAVMTGGGIPAPVQDAFTLLAARGDHPADVARGHDAFRALLETMQRNRQRRLAAAGFSNEQAAHLSALHTPNFM
ncbi:MAG TPA: ferritin-like domain-containing protein [Polyangia bacterium]|nr:ferritin-like domain-containing protein [Polyangia bacterium]